MSALPRPDSLELNQWLKQAQAGEITWTELAERLLKLEYTAGADHRPDTDRRRRCGFGEVIFGSGKSITDIVSIAQQLLESGQDEGLVTRLAADTAQMVTDQFPHSRYDDLGRTLRLARREISTVRPLPSPAPLPVAILTAGSTDLPVAREAL